MYQYNEYDETLVLSRVEEFRDQVQRYLAGDLSDEEFLPLRLQNGLYKQRHAWMLRVAIPYGTLSAEQLRCLAQVADRYDRGYGHFTTRQNIQFNWIELTDVPDILELLAHQHMHAIQTSGNCVRNITTEAFAGVAADEYQDPRPYAEILRQWATLHPEFLFLPRKFKIAITAADEDRAVIRAHDIGLYLYEQDQEARFRVLVGGGLGRTPILNQSLFEAVHWRDIPAAIEAILRVYNRYGRRDNKYKARIKILVKALGIDAFREEVQQEWQQMRNSGHAPAISSEELARVSAGFEQPLPTLQPDLEYGAWLARDSGFARWCRSNTRSQKQQGYVSVVISSKPHPAAHGSTDALPAAPGDLTSQQMRQLATMAEDYSNSEIRVTHEQNLVLANIAQRDLYPLWQRLRQQQLATPNIGQLTDIIACPGGDYCSLANSRTLPVTAAIQRLFDDQDQLDDIGTISLNISGCMNACGHHHVGNIGILGVTKQDQEWFQVTIGGQQGHNARLGQIIGPAFQADAIPGVIQTLTNTYRQHRQARESFVDCVQRLGIAPFKAAVYQSPNAQMEADI
mgnify:CR=1 FL=1